MSDPTKVLINSMITYGNHLKSAKTYSTNAIRLWSTIPHQVTNLTRQLLVQLKSDQLPQFSEKTILRIFEKLEASLQQFKEFDPENASYYEDLLKETNDCKLQEKRALKTRSPSSAGGSQQDASPAIGESTQAEGSTSDGRGQEQEEFTRLGNVEKKCLFCFCLFPLGKEVKKREPVHLWVGMDLVADSFVGSEMLDRLVGGGFIECIIGNNKMCNRYLMKEQVRSMVEKEMNVEYKLQANLLSVMYQYQKQHQPQQQQPTESQQQQQQKQETTSQKEQQGQEEASAPQKQPQEPQSPSQQTGFKKTLGKTISFLKRSATTLNQNNQGDTNVFGKLVLNNTGNTLPFNKLEQICNMYTDVKVLLLGNCFYYTEDSYNVFEAEALKVLTRHITQAAYLSLQRISGIVELPDAIYKLVNLKVLDLRGCPNLEFLPDGIQSLTKLTHLDLSECYLLDHIPKGIVSLTELRVLKGFIINPDVVSKTRNNRSLKNQRNTSSGASFSELKCLRKLKKLAIRTRRGNFPTADDLVTLCAMKELANLKIAWVCDYKNDISSVSESGRFPASLKKLELQATPESTLPRLLKLISDDKDNSLQKLYIRGGRFCHLGLENYCLPHVHTVRLRYLHELHVDRVQLKEFYPNARLEVFDCPKLQISYPGHVTRMLYDENEFYIFMY